MNKNKHAFETYANELAKIGKKNNAEFWLAVSEMGHELCKDSALFFSEIEAEALQEKTSLEKKPIKAPFVSSFENMNDGGKDSLHKAPDNLLDFDFISDSDSVVDKRSINDSIDFNQSPNTIKTEDSNESLKNAGSMAEDIKENIEFESLDFNDESSTTKINDYQENDSGVINLSDKNLPSIEEVSVKSFDFDRDFWQ